ncbi:MAG: elongation factor P [Dehalococcoidia bacterium]|nr:elongation factor P [Dehalococcoidia bacterium]
MIGAGELHKGMAIELGEKVYQVTDYHHIKMGRGSATIRLKLRDIRTGNSIERSFQASEKFTPAFLEHRQVQYLYNDGQLYYFMDSETYEQIELTADQVGEAANYLKDGASIKILTCQEKTISLDLPAAVELQVVETEPGFKGNTATGASKPAKMETGLTVQVPLFINVGDKINVSTQNGTYLEKAN